MTLGWSSQAITEMKDFFTAYFSRIGLLLSSSGKFRIMGSSVHLLIFVLTSSSYLLADVLEPNP